ncbi:hypothetical protein ACFTSF_21340 [Kribbella sp. NPDC056951]|uniref:hypothetical protein n=1 Tax=Kribbella sp. NPDC056951 TaxID=3345978 RepID=UPI00363FF5B1
MKRQGIAVLAGVAAVIAGTVLPAGTAAADGLPLQAPCTEQKDVTGPQFAVNLCDVTDADQFRTNLANEGNVHCGPTSLYNAMYYLGEHKGLPMRVVPNGQLITEYDPHDPADYDEATAWIGWLGSKAGMGPNPKSSTAKGNRLAFDAATVGAKESGWTVNRGEARTDDFPEFGLEIAKRLRQAPLQLWYGRYVLNADNTHTRTGGHAVTVVAAKGDVASGKVELTLHDPARSDDHGTPGYKDTQSDIRDETVTLYRVNIRTKSVDEETGVVTTAQHTFWRLFGESYTGTTLQYVEAFNWFETAPPVG